MRITLILACCIALALAVEPTLYGLSTASPVTLAPARISLPTTSGTIVVSPNGNHVAYIDTVNGKRMAVIDGKPGKPYEKIRAPWFERKPVKGDDRPNYSGLFFSPDGTRLAYAVIQYTGPNGEDWFAGRQRMVIDGITGKAYDEVSLPVFSPDSRHVVYVAKKVGGWVVVLDGKELETYEDIGGSLGSIAEVRRVSFNPQNNSIAFAMRKNGRWHLVSGDQVGPGYDDVTDITFSPRGTHLVYTATINNTFVPVIDGKERWNLQGAHSIKFSPDDRRLAAIINRPDKHMLLVDNQPMLSAPLVLRYRFSPDSRHVAGVINNGTGNDSQVLVDGTALPYTSMGWLPVYSGDGTRMADISGVNRKQAVVVDGRSLPENEGGIYNLTFNPDGRHVVYQVHGGKGARVVVDGIVRDMQQRILGSQETTLYFDGPGHLCSSSTETMFFFDTPDRFHYFAVKDGAIERVEVVIPPKTAALGMAPQPADP
ncbi:MAG: WD40 repeat domain-containing protein [Armatimonadota bacterium]